MAAHPETDTSLYFLKLGGSLITEKSRAHTPRPEVLKRLAGEIASVFNQNPGLKLIVGHGSGSFGHVPAKRYGTRQGVTTPEGWRGFAEVWYEATALTRIVVEALHQADLPVVAFSPSASAISRNGKINTWDLSPLRAALDAGLLPLTHGDVAFDQGWGGTILSTEDLFEYLTQHLHPKRILLASIEPGVWADYPKCQELVKEITPQTLQEYFPVLTGSSNTDVTGGMASKVQQSLALIETYPWLSVQIFSGETPGNVQRALQGEMVGTLLHSGISET